MNRSGYLRTARRHCYRRLWRCGSRCAAVLVVAWIMTPVASRAQLPLQPVDLDAIDQRLQEQDEAIRRLREEVSDAPGEKWSTEIGGQVMADYANWADAAPSIRPAAQDLFNWRRIRLHVGGSGYGITTFACSLTSSPTATLPMASRSPTWR